ncbi:zinc-binding alcohol dehydrogenase family protein [Salibacterium sp. K-3]
MKAVVCREPGQMEWTEQKEPECGPEDVLVDIKRIGICGTDLHAYSGSQPFFKYPRILGHELSGRVLAAGKEVTGIAAGDRVAVIPYTSCGTCQACRKGRTNACEHIEVIGVHRDGGMTEKITVPASNIVKTNALSFEEAAILEPLSIGAHAVKRAAVTPEDTVLVIGTGPIGMGIAAFAKQKGSRVITMDTNEFRLQFSKEWAGADDQLCPGPDTIRKLQERNNGNLPSIVFDATGNQTSMMNAFDFTAHGGRLIYAGLVKDSISFFDPDFHKKELTLLGSRNADAGDFEFVKTAVTEKEIDISRFITHYMSFEDVIDTFKNGFDPSGNMIKAVVRVNPETEELGTDA